MAALFHMVFSGPQVAAQQLVDAFNGTGYTASVDTTGNTGFTPADGEALVEVVVADHPNVDHGSYLEDAQQISRTRGFVLKLHAPMPEPTRP